MRLAWPAIASSTELSTTSHTRWWRPLDAGAADVHARGASGRGRAPRGPACSWPRRTRSLASTSSSVPGGRPAPSAPGWTGALDRSSERRKPWSEPRITALEVYQPGCDNPTIARPVPRLPLGPDAEVERGHTTGPEEGLAAGASSSPWRKRTWVAHGGLVDGQRRAARRRSGGVACGPPAPRPTTSLHRSNTRWTPLASGAPRPAQHRVERLADRGAARGRHRAAVERASRRHRRRGRRRPTTPRSRRSAPPARCGRRATSQHAVGLGPSGGRPLALVSSGLARRQVGEQGVAAVGVELGEHVVEQQHRRGCR